MKLTDRYRGAMLGLAVGDALGAPVESCNRGSFPYVDQMVSGGMFDVRPGEWTDDTAMALCLADSLIQCRGFSVQDQLQRYVQWMRNGYLSSRGECFGIGNQTRRALERFEQTGAIWCDDTQAAGNGSLMRLAPVPLAYAFDPELAIEMAAASSRCTHGSREAVDACRYVAGLIVGALAGVRREQLLAGVYEPVTGIWDERPLAPRILEVVGGSYRDKCVSEIRPGAYVVNTLETVLWVLARSKSFDQGMLLAVNLGGDADTIGAIYGQIAGAIAGEQAINASWRRCLIAADLIREMADQLYELCGVLSYSGS